MIASAWASGGGSFVWRYERAMATTATVTAPLAATSAAFVRPRLGFLGGSTSPPGHDSIGGRNRRITTAARSRASFIT
jgi:hypothetical protein